MLDAELGSVRPWELEAFTPSEEAALHARAREIQAERQEVT